MQVRQSLLVSSLAGPTTSQKAIRRGHRPIHTLSGLAECDSLGIPIKPTWSVNDLLSSYRRPSIPSATLKRLHELSALIPPAEGTPEHAKLTHEMEGLVRLVEAVKLVDTSQRKDAGCIPDGRIWAHGIELKQNDDACGENDDESGRKLLRHSSRVQDGLYIVDADKKK